jgi:hypothetical protein
MLSKQPSRWRRQHNTTADDGRPVMLAGCSGKGVSAPFLYINKDTTQYTEVVSQTIERIETCNGLKIDLRNVHLGMAVHSSLLV